MQWTAERHGGFSRARTVVRPAIDDATYGYETVNVVDQRRDPDSLLNWTERVVRARKECEEISWGDFVVLRTSAPEVLALRYDWRGASLVTLHNFGSRKVRVTFKVGGPRDGYLAEVFDGRHSRAHNDGAHRVTLDGYGWRWFRVGSADTTLDRSELSPLTRDRAR
jgi:maltose alpha-D-glucosyltransferase/alpha-amylase